MSKETLETLNTTTLIGHTNARGTAWHYRADLQSDEPNHYPGAIPVQDVARRLFSWDAQARPIAVERPADLTTMTHLDATGHPARWVHVPEKVGIVRSDRDDGHVMGVFTDAYTPHQYTDWLLTTVANLLDDDLSISSAGILRDGAIAWVEVSVPESITTPEGVVFRPNLLATTTFDGSLATTYKRTVTDVVCDNTREAALGEDGQEIRVKHTRNSSVKLANARQALALVHTTADAFASEVARLCRIRVDRPTWSRFLQQWVPLHDTQGERLTGKAATLANRKREVLDTLFHDDPRVTPWAGTAHAVLQAVNTYEHHAKPVRGTSRSDRNMLRTITGDFGTIDADAWRTLQVVMGQA